MGDKVIQPAENGHDNLFVVRDLKKWFPIQSGLLDQVISGHVDHVRAVDGISFDIRRGEVLGLAGESGSGKSTTGRALIRLTEPTAGKVVFDGQDLSKLNGRQMRRMRRRMQVIFQDPMASLSPRMSIGESIGHGLKIHMPGSADERRSRVMEMMARVGLTPPSFYYDKFAHQISGGQRQRVVIARALVTHPDFVLADEPIAMADVSVRALLLDLMLELKKDLNLTYLFITHDLATAKYICDRIGILYLGKLAEIGNLREIYAKPLHPYTQALLAAVSIPDPHKRRTMAMPEGEIPNPIHPPSGCRFHPRCPMAQPDCAEEEPVLRELRPNHRVACHHAEEFL